MTQSQVIAPDTIEELVSHVRGVIAVRVVQDPHGQIDELHVVGSPDRSPKQMVRDVESILYVQGGVRVNHRKISLVQVHKAAIQPTVPRVQLQEIIHDAEDERPTVTVTLSVGEQRYQGAGRSRPGQNEAPEFLAAYATIHALHQLIGPHNQLRLENLDRQQFGHLAVCLSHLSLTVDDHLETLLGISVVRDDSLAVAARAVLDAVNRRLQRLLGGAG